MRRTVGDLIFKIDHHPNQRIDVDPTKRKLSQIVVGEEKMSSFDRSKNKNRSDQSIMTTVDRRQP